MEPLLILALMLAGFVCVAILLNNWFDKPCPWCGGKVDWVFPVEERPTYFQCKQCRRLL